MPGRKFTSTTNYRYGFNGKEEDDEVKGDGNQQDYGMRIYDPRLGRFLSVDPITSTYPMLTPYQFASNSPILGIDLDGLEFSTGSIHAVEAGINYTETKVGQDAMKGDRKAQEAFNSMMTVNMKIGFAQFSLASAFVLGPYVGAVGRSTTGTIIRITTDPKMLASASSFGLVVNKYAPDVINFVYGAFTGDALEPLPSNSNLQASDAGAFLRNIFKSPIIPQGWLKAAGVTDAILIKGSNNSKVAVIGQGMDKVTKVAGGLKNPEIFKASLNAITEWDNLLKEYNGKLIPEEIVKKTKIFQENQKWIKEVKEKGYDILDTGGGSTSTFYNMEKEVVYGSKN